MIRLSRGIDHLLKQIATVQDVIGLARPAYMDPHFLAETPQSKCPGNNYDTTTCH